MYDAIAMFSSGIASWAAAKRYAESHPHADGVLLFADTLIEDEDNYRFLHQAAENIGWPLEIIADGRTPWEVMSDERIIANSRIDPCSKILKRQLLNRWRDEHGTPGHTDIIFGLSWDEVNRLDRLQARTPDWSCVGPLTDAPYLTKPDMIKWAREEGVEPPRMYAMGFPHANCGGFCVKAGQETFRLLHQNFPERYRAHEAAEEELRQIVGDHSILSDRRGDGQKKVLTLKRFREEYIEGPCQPDLFDFGGCGCAIE